MRSDAAMVQRSFRSYEPATRTALIVEDDDAVRRMVERHLVRAAFAVRSAAGECEAIRLADGTDVAIVDLGLLDGSGLSLCERLREGPLTDAMPIVVLTARDDLETKLRLFAAGADDYLTKPFEPLELLARIEAAIRRADPKQAWRRIGPLAVHPAGDAVLRGSPIPLTAAERAVLGGLAARFPATVAQAELRSGAWARSGVTSDNVVEVVVGRIRRKLAAAGGGVEVQAVRRAGYVLRISATTKETQG